ncbi:MAG: cyclic nucleotide-binding domain-containing protein [Actinomycetota bacterium]
MDEALPRKLAELPLFAHLDDDALAAVAKHVDEVEAPAGQVLIEIGQPGAGMFVLEEGELEVQLPTGEAIILGPGEFVGDLALLTDEPHVARVRAHTEVRCLAISRQDFTELLQEQPRIALAMLPVLARRLASSLSFR